MTRSTNLEPAHYMPESESPPLEQHRFELGPSLALNAAVFSLAADSWVPSDVARTLQFPPAAPREYVAANASTARDRSSTGAPDRAAPKPAIGNPVADLSAAALSVLAEMEDNESLDSITICGVGDGHVLSDGVHSFTGRNCNDSVSVENWNLEELTLTQLRNHTGNVTLRIRTRPHHLPTSDSTSRPTTSTPDGIEPSGLDATSVVDVAFTVRGVSANSVRESTSGAESNGPVTVSMFSSVCGDGCTFGATKAKLIGNSGPCDELQFPGEGSWKLDNSTGDVTFTPERDFTAYPTPVSCALVNTSRARLQIVPLSVDYVPRPTNSFRTSADVAATNLPVTLDVLANEVVPENPLDAISVRIVGTSDPGRMLVVAGEGTWTVDRFSGEVSFAPQAGFTGDPTPITYRVSSSNGDLLSAGAIVVEFVRCLPVSNDDAFASEFDWARAR